MKAIIGEDLVVGTGSGDLVGIDIPDGLGGVPLAHLRFDDGELFDASSATTWHIDESGARHVVAGDGRTPLECSLSDEIERDGTGGWRVIDALARAKDRRKADIDAEAERQRLRWITPGAGQAMTYQAKVDEARSLQSETGSPDTNNYPLLSAEVGITAETLVDVAVVVIGAYRQWLQIGAAIEAARLGSKRAVDLADAIAGVEAVAPAWPNPQPN